LLLFSDHVRHVSTPSPSGIGYPAGSTGEALNANVNANQIIKAPLTNIQRFDIAVQQ
jgi:hypothetical protein